MSLSNALTLLLEAGSVVSALLWSLTVGLVFRPSRLDYKHNVLFSVMKAAVKCKTLSETILKKETAGVYHAFVQKHGLPTRVTQLHDHTACLLWLGDEKAENVLLYLHGGAYIHPAAPGHFLVMTRLIEAARAAGKSLQVAVLQYDLATKQPYPTQLRQAVAGLRYILDEQSVPSEKIYLAGDSAGGNLAIALFSHLGHPHPELDQINLRSPSSKLGGAFLFSPWVSFTNDSPSWKENHDTDFLVSESLDTASTRFLGNNPADNYSVPINAPSSWWEHAKVRDIGITYGKNETFAADVITIAKTIKGAYDHVEISGFDGESHAQAVVDATIGWPVIESENFMREWFLRLL